MKVNTYMQILRIFNLKKWNFNLKRTAKTISLIVPVILFTNFLYALYTIDDAIQDKNTPYLTAETDTSYRTISIDGTFTDWEGVSPVCDNIVVMNDDACLDLAKVWVAHDDNWVYLRFEVGNVVNLQGMSCAISLCLDIDGNEETGTDKSKIGGSTGLKGADIELLFSPGIKNGNNSHFYGTSAYVYTENTDAQPDETATTDTTKINPYLLQTSFAPTTAASQFELRIKRGILIEKSGINTFTGQTFSGLLVTKTRSGLIIDNTDTFTHVLNNTVSSKTDATQTDINTKEISTPDLYNVPVIQIEGQNEPVYALSSRKAQSVRFITWNVEQGSIFNNPEPFSRVLYALQPDVICFQELGNNANSQKLKDWLDEYVPERSGWEATVSPDTGTGIATRLPNTPMGPVQMPELTTSNRKLRATTLMINSSQGAGRRIATMSTHLKCCGIAGDSSDLKRIDEAEIIHTIMQKISMSDSPSAIVIMGDFNLVGSKKPLDIIAANLDYDNSNLLVVNPYVLGDNTNTTWRDDGQSFLPGRLDYILVSDSTVTVERAFILDSSKLDSNTLKYYNIQEQDNHNASDHLPSVVDLTW